jgi:hypothetical protein
VRLNHYAVRSRQEFEQKTARHGSSRLAPRYFAYHDRNDVRDPALVSYTSEVRARLAALQDDDALADRRAAGVTDLARAGEALPFSRSEHRSGPETGCARRG